MLRTDFLMIVTPVDLGIARYTIPALARLVAASPSLNAKVYCNGMTAEQVAEVDAMIAPFARFTSYDNSERFDSAASDVRVGEFYVTDAGNRELREGAYENCGEIWTRELVALPGDLVGIVDADFEIFDNQFALEIVSAFESDERLGVFSTERRLEVHMVESYSQEDAIVADLYATWFCVYRRSALEICHDFTYAEVREAGKLPIMYDHSARLQKVLIEEHGFSGRSLQGRLAKQYLHYGAFAKNRSLRGRSLGLYRVLRIGIYNGWLQRVKSPALAFVVRALSFVAWSALGMSRYDAERQRYLFDQPSGTASGPRDRAAS